MPKYLIEASYTMEGLKGIMKTGGTARRAAVQQAVESVGGKFEAAAFAATAYPAGLIITTNKSLAAILPRAYAANNEKKEQKRTHVWD